MHDIFIGVDGGGSQTKVRIEDSMGTVLGETVGGPANIRLSAATAWQSILMATQKILSQYDINLSDQKYRFHLGLGLAGCESQIARKEFLARPHAFTTLCLQSDAHIACLAAHAGKDGAIIIIGTGSVGYQIYQGKIIKVGGWGFPHSDEGSGAWMGMEAVRLTFQWLDKRIVESALLRDIFQYFQADVVRFADWANHASSTEFAKLAPFVIQHAEQKDRCAIHLLQQAAHQIDIIANSLAQQSKPVPCCLLGGIATVIQPWLSSSLKARLAVAKFDPPQGAIHMLRDTVQLGQVHVE